MISAVTELNAKRQEPYLRLVERLSQLSVKKHYEAYRDVDWDGPDGRLDPDDPRFCLPAFHPLLGTAWYNDLPAHLQSRFGLDWVCEKLKYGIAFEQFLSIGLLEFAQSLPNNSPEYRYAMHEVIEESQHSLMFQQFINQSGRDPDCLSRVEMRTGSRVARFGRTFPEMFFFFVLAGEVFIDRDNRDALAAKETMHPLLRKVIQIHVTEEARHVCFAERYLQQNMPRLSPFRRFRVRMTVPKIMAHGERLMMRPSARLIREYQIPKATVKQAFGRGTPHAARVREIVAPVYALLDSKAR